jgi:acyl phosphate:glycerol-3-phosphate acyltransferase
MLPWYLNIGLILVAYLLGSIPTGYWAGKLLQGIDIRQVGSGSTGATNVLRSLGKGPAIAVLTIDVLKGAIAIALVRWAYLQSTWFCLAPNNCENADTVKSMLVSQPTWLAWVITLAGLAAVWGHSKSILLGFSGGKSVATSLGVLLAMSWQVGLATFGVFGLSLAISRIVSLSSIAAALAVMGLMFLLKQPLPYGLFAIAGGTYVIWRHRSNIQRLIAGTEPRLGQKLPQAAESEVS